MKTRKTFLTLAILLISGFGFAQPPGGGQRGGQQGPPPIPNEKQIKVMVSDLADEISLSEDQETTILELYIEHFEEIEEQTSGNKRPDREEMESMKTLFEEHVKEELTKDQIKKYEAYLKKQASQLRRR